MHFHHNLLCLNQGLTFLRHTHLPLDRFYLYAIKYANHFGLLETDPLVS